MVQGVLGPTAVLGSSMLGAYHDNDDARLVGTRVRKALMVGGTPWYNGFVVCEAVVLSVDTKVPTLEMSLEMLGFFPWDQRFEAAWESGTWVGRPSYYKVEWLWNQQGRRSQAVVAGGQWEGFLTLRSCAHPGAKRPRRHWSGRRSGKWWKGRRSPGPEGQTDACGWAGGALFV